MTNASINTYKALKVLALNPDLSEFLKEHDPKAYKQMNVALAEFEIEIKEVFLLLIEFKLLMFNQFAMNL